MLKKKSPATLSGLSLLAGVFRLGSGEVWHLTVFLSGRYSGKQRPRVQLGKVINFKYTVRVAPTLAKVLKDSSFE